MNPPNQSRRRIRPRFYAFVLLAAAVPVGFILRSHSPAAAAYPRHMKAASLSAPPLQVQSVWFSLPRSLSNYAYAVSGSSMQIAGGTGHHGSSALTAVISPQGVVQGPSLALPAGASLLPRAGSTVAAGGLTHNKPTASAISLDTGTKVPGFLPETLAYAAPAWCPGTSTAYLSGGESQDGSLQTTIWEDVNGAVKLWGHLPVGVQGASSAAGPDTLLVEGGTLAGNLSNHYIWIFQKKSHALLETLTLPAGLTGAAVVYAQGSYWIMGGMVQHRIVNTIWQIQASQLVKAQATLPTPLCDFGAAHMDHGLWIVGGRTAKGPVRTIREISFLKSARHVRPRHTGSKGPKT